MNKKKYEIIVGIIVVVAIIFVVIGKSMFSDKQKRREYYEINVRFTEVGGLEQGSEVLVNGVRAGNVDSIDLKNNHVSVKIALQKGIGIFANAEIAVREYGLMGSRRIEIRQQYSKQKIDLSHSLQGIYMPGLHETISNINSTINNLNKVVKLINPKKLDEFGTILSRTDKLIFDLNSIFSRNGQFSLSLRKFDKLCFNADSVISKTGLELNQISSFTVSQLPEVAKLLRRMNNTFEAINKKKSNFERFTSNDSLYIKTYETLNDLDSLIIDIKENPKNYFRLF